MKTEELIAALAADNETRGAPMSRAFAVDLGLGFAVSAAFFFATMGLRDTFFASLSEPRFLFKFVFSLTMAASGFFLAWRLSRPGADPGLASKAVVLAPILVVLASLAEMAATPSNLWAARMIGHNAAHCLMAIPAMSLAPLAGLLAGAPPWRAQQRAQRRSGGGVGLRRPRGDALRHELPRRFPVVPRGLVHDRDRDRRRCRLARGRTPVALVIGPPGNG